MPRIEQISPERPRSRKSGPDVRPEPVATEMELSQDAASAIEEGRMDHAAGRKFTMAEIKRELGQ